MGVALTKDESDVYRTWHHSPAHLFLSNQAYIVTAGTLKKEHIFSDNRRLSLLQEELFCVSAEYGWQLQAWALFSNHYHFVGQAPEQAFSLRDMIRRFHSVTAVRVNELDGVTGRGVWFQYWDTCLTYEKSYYARLKYVHNNAVKHGLVMAAEDYPFCSAAWFKTHADPSLIEKVKRAGHDRIRIKDDF